MNNEFNKLHVENTRMFLNSSETISIGSVSKLLQKCNIKMGRNKFYDFLIKNDYFQENNLGLWVVNRSCRVSWARL